MLHNAYLLAKIGADTAENERNLPKICQKLATTLRVHTAVLHLAQDSYAEAAWNAFLSARVGAWAPDPSCDTACGA